MHKTEILLRRSGRKLVEPLCFYVDDEDKRRYDILTQIHKIRTPEYLRLVLKPELQLIWTDGGTLNLTTQKEPRRHPRLKEQITLWVDKETFDLYESIKTTYPNIPRAERVRRIFKSEINRIWAIEGLSSNQAS